MRVIEIVSAVEVDGVVMSEETLREIVRLANSNRLVKIYRVGDQLLYSLEDTTPAVQISYGSKD